MAPLEKSYRSIGHRPKFFKFENNEDHPDCLKIKRSLHDTIEYLILDKGITRFISGGAVGVNTWAAEAVAVLRVQYPGITLEIALPYPTMWEQFEDHDRMRYQRLPGSIDKFTHVYPKYTKKCMHQRNRYMVDIGFPPMTASLSNPMRKMELNDGDRKVKVKTCRETGNVKKPLVFEGLFLFYIFVTFLVAIGYGRNNWRRDWNSNYDINPYQLSYY